VATKNQRFAYSSHNAVADTSKMQTEILSISISISFSLSVKPTLFPAYCVRLDRNWRCDFESV